MAEGPVLHTSSLKVSSHPLPGAAAIPGAQNLLIPAMSLFTSIRVESISKHANGRSLKKGILVAPMAHRLTEVAGFVVYLKHPYQ